MVTKNHRKNLPMRYLEDVLDGIFHLILFVFAMAWFACWLAVVFFVLTLPLWIIAVLLWWLL